MRIELDNIYNLDCLEGMRRMEPQSVDAIICDLPYGTTHNKWDVIIPFDELWECYHHVCKPTAPVILFSQLPFAVDLVNSNRDQFRYEWVWKKRKAVGFLNAKKMPMRAHENILVFYEKLPQYNPIKRNSGKPIGRTCPRKEDRGGGKLR